MMKISTDMRIVTIVAVKNSTLTFVYKGLVENGVLHCNGLAKNKTKYTTFWG